MSDDDVSKLFKQLPDEEPPATGMAALMAAAHAKAAEMAPPPRKSLWARFLDGLKAPPVLALATVVVLIGGAIIIKNHDTALDATAKIDLGAEATPTVTAAVTPATPDAGAPQGEVAVVPAPVVPAEPEDKKLEAPPVKQPAPHIAVASKPPERRMAPAKPPALDTGKDEERALGGAAPADPAVATNTPPPPPPPPAAAPQGMTIATDDAPTTAPGKATATNTRPSPALVEQLLHACQAAAQKRDCPTARTLATQIHDRDASFYRTRVLKDADIVKCL